MGLELVDVGNGVGEEGGLVHLGNVGDHRSEGVEAVVELLTPLPLRLHVVHRRFAADAGLSTPLLLSPLLLLWFCCADKTRDSQNMREKGFVWTLELVERKERNRNKKRKEKKRENI